MAMTTQWFALSMQTNPRSSGKEPNGNDDTLICPLYANKFSELMKGTKWHWQHINLPSLCKQILGAHERNKWQRRHIHLPSLWISPRLGPRIKFPPIAECHHMHTHSNMEYMSWACDICLTLYQRLWSVYPNTDSTMYWPELGVLSLYYNLTA